MDNQEIPRHMWYIQLGGERVGVSLYFVVIYIGPVLFSLRSVLCPVVIMSCWNAENRSRFRVTNKSSIHYGVDTIENGRRITFQRPRFRTERRLLISDKNTWEELDARDWRTDKNGDGGYDEGEEFFSFRF